MTALGGGANAGQVVEGRATPLLAGGGDREQALDEAGASPVDQRLEVALQVRPADLAQGKIEPVGHASSLVNRLSYGRYSPSPSSASRHMLSPNDRRLYFPSSFACTNRSTSAAASRAVRRPRSTLSISRR